MDTAGFKNQVKTDIDAVTGMPALAEVKAKYLGKKGSVTVLFEQLKDIKDREEKKRQAGRSMSSKCTWNPPAWTRKNSYYC